VRSGFEQKIIRKKKQKEKPFGKIRRRLDLGAVPQEKGKRSSRKKLKKEKMKGGFPGRPGS